MISLLHLTDNRLVEGYSHKLPYHLSQYRITDKLAAVLAADREEICKTMNKRIPRGTEEVDLSDTLTNAITKAITLIRGMLDVFFVHFDQLPSWNQLLVIATKWIHLAVEDRLEDYYKTQSCTLFSLVTKQHKLIGELPEHQPWNLDKPGYLIGGWFWRYCKVCISRPLTKEVTEQFYALMNVKRAGLAISAEKQQTALVKHIKNMTGAEYKPQDVITNTFGPNTHVEREDVLDHIKSCMSRLISKDFTERITPKWRVPSVNACYEASSKEGGAHVHFFDSLCALHTYEFIGYARYKTRVTPIYVPYHVDDLTANCRMAYRSLKALRSVPTAKVHIVLEPFKARIITAGEGVTYQLGRMLQKPIHTVMRKNKLFHLTGAPCTVDFINEVYGDRVLKDDEFYVAGDYSAATDGMHPDLNKLFIDEVCLLTGIDSLMYDAAKRCMAGHELTYDSSDLANSDLPREVSLMSESNQNLIQPLIDSGKVFFASEGKKSKKKVLKVVQTWGQLMGSPLSFPILCYANAAVAWCSAEIYEDRKMSLKDFINQYKPIFNGDDTSFISNPNHYKIWKSVASVAGLNASLGKNYCSPHFVMINSEIFFANQTDDKVEFFETFVLNPGLVKGQAKVLGDTRKPGETRDDKISSSTTFHIGKNALDTKKSDKKSVYGTLLPMVDQLNMACRKASEIQQEKVQQLFMNHVIPKLKETDRPWSLPRWAGGLGLPFGSSSELQRKIMGRFLMEDELKLTSYAKSVPACQVWANAVITDIYDKLGVEYIPAYLRQPSDVLGQSETLALTEDRELDLNQYFGGAERIDHGVDCYGNLLRETKSIPWVNPVSEETAKYYGTCIYTSRQLDSRVFV